LGNNCAVILNHHGAITVGKDFAEAFYLMYYLNLSCKAQLLAMSTNNDLVEVSPDTVEISNSSVWNGYFKIGHAEWNALKV
jgi:ribulose-5-phosphate 4-epimerase/fuculose-1-phosphate aldolase